MRWTTNVVAIGTAVACALAPQGGVGQDGWVTVAPRETPELLANPGIGWQTFHATARQDRSLPSWIPSTLHYARWGWGELEPQPGQLNVEFLDRVLRETRDAGQKLAFRVMCCSTTKGQPYHPPWLTSVGGKEVAADYEGDSPLPVPDFDDPTVLERHLSFIQRLGERYDGHADLDHVDIGSIGWWGEWHMSGSDRAKLPKLAHRLRIIDGYLAAFRRTPLLMLIGGGECLTYACQRGAGWRADCLGDLGGFSSTWNHMRKGYPGWFQQAGIADAWKTAPVAWETCWDLRKWVEEGWSLRYIFNYALACHASVINNKSAPLPRTAAVRAEVERFLRRLGYRLIITELKHAGRVAVGGKLELAAQWRNVGSAPCYGPYRVAYRLSGARGTPQVVATDTAVNGWLPGSIELFTDQFLREPRDLPLGEIATVRDAITLPADLPAGEYELAVAVVDPATLAPAIQLGIEGRAPDGWYPLSKVTVGPTGR